LLRSRNWYSVIFEPWLVNRALPHFFPLGTHSVPLVFPLFLIEKYISFPPTFLRDFLRLAPSVSRPPTWCLFQLLKRGTPFGILHLPPAAYGSCFLFFLPLCFGAAFFFQLARITGSFFHIESVVRPSCHDWCCRSCRSASQAFTILFRELHFDWLGPPLLVLSGAFFRASFLTQLTPVATLSGTRPNASPPLPLLFFEEVPLCSPLCLFFPAQFTFSCFSAVYITLTPRFLRSVWFLGVLVSF